MKILHVCVKDDQISTEITDEGEQPSFIPTAGYEISFILRIDSEYISSTQGRLREGVSSRTHLEGVCKSIFSSLRAQGFTITPPDK